MDMMEMRFRMMAMLGGGNVGAWKQMQITAPQNFTVFSDVKTWIDSVLPSGSRIFVLKDNIVANDTELLYEYIGTEIINGINTYFFQWNSGMFRPFGTNNTSQACNVNSGDTFTIFYQ